MRVGGVSLTHSCEKLIDLNWLDESWIAFMELAGWRLYSNFLFRRDNAERLLRAVGKVFIFWLDF